MKELEPSVSTSYEMAFASIPDPATAKTVVVHMGGQTDSFELEGDDVE